MNRNYIRIEGRECPYIADSVLLGSWEEVQGLSATELKAELRPESLDGLILRGYEMKWNVTNENGERYERTAFDEFLQKYFVDGGLNMPVDINHEGWNNWRSYCGRVLYIETNTVGFYFVIYVPRTYADYDRLLWGLKNGIIQGFSKEGYATDWEPHISPEGRWEYETIKSMKLLSVSLVSLPANGLAFEKMQQIKNALVFVKNIEDNAERKSTLEAMFNNK